MPTAPIAPVESSFKLDRRQAIGIAVLCVGLGLVIGFKLAGGVPSVIEKPVFVPVEHKGPDCAECAEKKIQRERAAAGNQPE